MLRLLMLIVFEQFKVMVSTFFTKGKPVFSNSPKSLPKNLPDCPVSCKWIFDNFALAGELFAKVLRSLET